MTGSGLVSLLVSVMVEGSIYLELMSIWYFKIDRRVTKAKRIRIDPITM
jgi:hypothetical protein